MTLPAGLGAAGQAGLAALRADPARALVALDFDGTLAPVVARPQDARPAAGTADVLVALGRAVGTLAILTGRPAAVAARLGGLAGVPGLVVIGHYGLQRWEAGRMTSPAPLPAVAVARDRLAALLRDADPRVRIEDKLHSVAVHTRETADPAGELARLTPVLAELAAELGLSLAPGRLVAELRPPGVDKGSALEALAREVGAYCVLVAGDDLGDLAAFETVARLRHGGTPGIAVAVGGPEVPAELVRAADLVVDGPAGLLALLGQLARELRPG
ncbi:MAG: trehalose-phosphatase, partial [Mycobacteriales bacterium]